MLENLYKCRCNLERQEFKYDAGTSYAFSNNEYISNMHRTSLMNNHDQKARTIPSPAPGTTESSLIMVKQLLHQTAPWLKCLHCQSKAEGFLVSLSSNNNTGQITTCTESPALLQ